MCVYLFFCAVFHLFFHINIFLYLLIIYLFVYLQGKQCVLEVAERIGKLQKECGMTEPVEDFMASFHFGLMEVVFEWARGMVSSVNRRDYLDHHRLTAWCSLTEIT